MKIRGATPEIRATARARRATLRRAADYTRRASEAGRDQPRRRLEIACNWLTAIGSGLSASDAAVLAGEVTELAKRWNGRTA